MIPPHVLTAGVFAQPLRARVAGLRQSARPPNSQSVLGASRQTLWKHWHAAVPAGTTAHDFVSWL